MRQATTESCVFPILDQPNARDVLTDLLHRGARQMLVAAVEAEVGQWIDGHAHLTDERGRRQVVRNGHADARTIVTGVGPMEVSMPRVHDRRPPQARQRFTSNILPP